MCSRLQPHASQERLLIFEGLPAQLEVCLYAVVRDTFGWLPTPPASCAEEGPPAVAAEGSTQGPWHAIALEKMRGGATHGTGGSGSAGSAAAAAVAAAAGEGEVVCASPPHLSLCALPSAEAEPCTDQPCTDQPCAVPCAAAEDGAESAIPGATGGASEGAGGAAGGAGLAAVRVLEVPSLRKALLVAVAAVAEVREAGVRGWAARRGVGVEQIQEALEVHEEATARAAADGAGAGEGEGGGSDTCDADVVSLRLLLAPSPAPVAINAVVDAGATGGDEGDVGDVGDEGDAPLKGPVEGLHARFLLEAFLCGARREMAELQSGFDEMASQMRACGVYLGGGTQPKETKEQLKELGALKDFVGELRR